MFNFGVFFKSDWSRFFRKRNVVIFLVTWALLVVFTITGIYEYRGFLERQPEFREIEALNFEKYPDYDVYGDSGINVLFCPGPMGIFFQNIGISPDLIGKLDSIVNISIFDNYKSKALFRGLFAGIWSFTGIIFVFGSLLCLFWTAELPGKSDYLRFLCGFLPPLKVFVNLIFARLVLLALLLLVIFAGSYLLLVIFDVAPVSGLLGKYVFYYFVSLAMLVFFSFLGLIAGLLRTKPGRVLSIMITWIIFVFWLPGLSQYIVQIRTDGSIKDYRTEIKKFRVIVDFEKYCIEKSGKYDRNNLDGERKFMDDYLKNFYPKIEALENELHDRIKSNIELFNAITLITPATIFYSAVIEISGRGYGSFLDFYNYIRQLKRKFVRFYIDRFYYHDPKKMVNFIKGENNLYFASSSLPADTGIKGIIFLLWLSCLFLLAYRSLKKMLYSADKKDMRRFLDQELVFDKGRATVMEVDSENFKNLLYMLLSGEFKRLKHSYYYNSNRVVANGLDLSGGDIKLDFVYIPGPDALPEDIKVKHFVTFIAAIAGLPAKKIKPLLNQKPIEELLHKRIKEIDNHQRAEILLILSSLKKAPFYFFFDTAVGLTADFVIPFKERLETLKSDAAVLYITTDDRVRTAKTNTGRPFLKNPDWLEQVDYIKNMQE